MKITIQKDGYKIIHEYSIEVKNKVFNRLMEYFNKYEAYDGETIHQSDEPNLGAIIVLSDIADDLFEYEEDDDYE